MKASHDFPTSISWNEKEQDRGEIAITGGRDGAATSRLYLVRDGHVDMNDDVETSSLYEQVQAVDHVLEEIRRHSVLSSSYALGEVDINDFDDTSTWRTDDTCHNRRLQQELQDVDEAYRRDIGGRFRKLRNLGNTLTLRNPPRRRPMDDIPTPVRDRIDSNEKLVDASMDTEDSLNLDPSNHSRQDAEVDGVESSSSDDINPDKITINGRGEIHGEMKTKRPRFLKHFIFVLIILLVIVVTVAIVLGRHNQLRTSASRVNGGQTQQSGSNAFLDVNAYANTTTQVPTISPTLDTEYQQSELIPTNSPTTSRPATLEPSQSPYTVVPTNRPADNPISGNVETISPPSTSPTPPVGTGSSSLAPSAGENLYVDDYDDDNPVDQNLVIVPKGKGHPTERYVGRRHQRRRRRV